MTFIETLVGIVLVAVGAKILWVATLINDERKKAYRAGTHDYYGNKIKEDE
jgi:hypothetical protein